MALGYRLFIAYLYADHLRYLPEALDLYCFGNVALIIAGAAPPSGGAQQRLEPGKREDLLAPYGGRGGLSHAPCIPQRPRHQQRRLHHDA